MAAGPLALPRGKPLSPWRSPFPRSALSSGEGRRSPATASLPCLWLFLQLMLSGQSSCNQCCILVLGVPSPMSVSRCCSVAPRSFGGQRARLHKLWTSSLELCSVDIALDRRRQEVLVVPPRAPCEDGDHVPAGDVVPALAGARRRLTVRESFTEIASDVVPTWSPIPVSAGPWV